MRARVESKDLTNLPTILQTQANLTHPTGPSIIFWSENDLDQRFSDPNINLDPESFFTWIFWPEKCFHTLSEICLDLTHFLVKIIFGPRGWFIMIDKKFELNTRARIQAAGWDMRAFGHFEIVSPRIPRSFMFFWNFDTQILKICKTSWGWAVPSSVPA